MNKNDLLQQLSDEFASGEKAKSEVTWLRSVLMTMPVSVGADGTATATTKAWLEQGPELAVAVSSLLLIDRYPLYYERRDLYFFYGYQGDAPFSWDNYWSPHVVPAKWIDSRTYTKIDCQKLYHDDIGYFGGWSSQEEALSSLGKTALDWARNYEQKER